MTKNWANAFNINIEKLQQWYQKKPQTHSALYWLINENKLPFDKYQQWACKQFQLPYLKSDFFSKEPNEHFWNTYRPLFKWTPEIVPIHQWSDKLYIATLDPSFTPQLACKTQLVLAHPNDIEQWHQKLLQLDLKSALPSFPEEPELSIEEDSAYPLQNAENLYPEFSQKAFPTFKKMRTYYKQCILFKIENNAVKPWAWNKNWTPLAGKTKRHFSLQEPSIFQIPYKTQKPFHGPISINDINELFFTLWNGRVIPPSITIMPLTYANSTFALLLGVSEKIQPYSKVLPLMEEWTEDLKKNIIELPEKMTG